MRNILLSAVVGLAFFHVACGGKPASEPDYDLGGPTGMDPSSPITGGSTPDGGSVRGAQDSGVPGTDSGADASTDSGADSGIPVTVDAGVPGCAASTLPTDNICSIDEGFGVFVSASLGTAAGDGTRAKPFASMQTAINAAKASNKRVYACAGSYAENLTFADGVSVFGYFACSGGSWTTSAGRAIIAAPSSPAAHATNIVTATRVEGLEIVAPDAAASSGSSIGLMANGSPALAFFHSRIHAGIAKAGDSGVEGIALQQSGSINGGANTTVNECGFNLFACDAANTGGAGGTSICTGAPGHNGGAGGSGGFAGRYQSGPVPVVEPPTRGLPLVGTATTAVGANFDGVHSAASGANGVDGATGTSALAMGTISASGYTPADGAPGVDGTPGMGGGGGSGHAPVGTLPNTNSDWYGVSGAGGGAGGCPGLAGTPGKGGGASIAILAVDSPMQFHASTIESSAGGAGGLGTFGSTATLGGYPGDDVAGPSYGPNPLAGKGGRGGDAGMSGQGAGGPSIGVASHGAAPTLDAPPVVGAGGAAAPARGNLATDQTIAASAAGLSAPTYTF